MKKKQKQKKEKKEIDYAKLTKLKEPKIDFIEVRNAIFKTWKENQDTKV